MSIEVCRRGTSNPNVWLAAFYTSILLPVATVLFRASSPYLVTTFCLAAAGGLAGLLIPLAASAFQRKLTAQNRVFTESLSCLGWQLWQENYTGQEIHRISIEEMFAGETTLPYAFKIFVHLKNGTSLPSLVYVKQRDAEALVGKLKEELELE